MGDNDWLLVRHCGAEFDLLGEQVLIKVIFLFDTAIPASAMLQIIGPCETKLELSLCIVDLKDQDAFATGANQSCFRQLKLVVNLADRCIKIPLRVSVPPVAGSGIFT